MTHDELQNNSSDTGTKVLTHDELLAICDNYSFKDSAEPVKALRAVVELHKPTHYDGKDICVQCANIIDPWDENTYPCPTIQAIEKELK